LSARCSSSEWIYSRLLVGLPDAQSLEEGKYVVARRVTIISNDRLLKAFVREVTATLLEGKRHRTPGLGTFSTCASAELREYSSGGPRPSVSGPHAKVVRAIVEAMQCDQGVDLPLLGRMAVVPIPGGRPNLIFHGAKELNCRLAGARSTDASRPI
jgi:hypothetical protein